MNRIPRRFLGRRIVASTHRFIVVWLAALLAVTASLGVSPGTAQAHSPHDIIRAVAVSPDYANDQTLFLLTSTPGWWKPTDLYRSTDGGVSWHTITNGLDHRHEAVDIVLSPNFAADGTAFIATEGDGVYRTTDGAASWSAVNDGLSTGYLSRLALSPAYATDTTLLAAGATGGLYQSQDGGDSWRTVYDVTVKFHSVAFARGAQGAPVGLAGDASGSVHRSDDGGQTWRRLWTRPEFGAVNELVASPDFASDGTFFVGAESKGVWRVEGDGQFHAAGAVESLRDAADLAHASPALATTDDRPPVHDHGQLHATVDAANVYLPALRHVSAVDPHADNLSIRALAVSPDFAQDGTVLAAALRYVAMRSTSGGATWHLVGSEDALTDPQADEYHMPDFYDAAISPNFAQDRTMFLAGFSGLFKSEDGGATWQQLETVANALPSGLSVSPDFANDGQVVVVTQHSGTLVTHDRGETWETWNRGLQEGRLYTVDHSPDFARDRLFFTFARDRVRQVADQTSGYAWDAWSFGERPAEPGSSESVKINFPEASAISPDFARDRTLFMGARHFGVYASPDGGPTWQLLWQRENSPIAFALSPNYANDDTLFVSILNDGLFKSTNRGQSWERVMAGAPWVTGSSVAEFPYWHYVIYPALSPDYASDRTIFAGTADGLFKSVDGGESWQELEPFVDRFIVALAVSPNYAADRTILVSVKGLGLFRSTDSGANFSAIAPALNRSQHLLRNIEFAPDGRTVLAYADHVMRSDDAGDTWRVLERPVRYENHKPRVRYAGAWQTRADAASSMSSHASAGEAGASVALDFAGTGVSWLGTRRDDLGIANVYVDGALMGEVDQYAAAQQSEAVLYSISSLSPGPHSIIVEATGRSNPASSGGRITFDAFDVFGYEAANSFRAE